MCEQALTGWSIIGSTSKFNMQWINNKKVQSSFIYKFI
jgi:hypothetical protein